MSWIAETIVPLVVLAVAGGIGGSLRYDFDAAARRRRHPRWFAFPLIGATTACLVYALGEPLFPAPTETTRYYTALIGFGSLSGFWGLELQVRLAQRLPGSQGSALKMDGFRRKIREDVRKLASGVEAAELQKRFPSLAPFYEELLAG